MPGATLAEIEAIFGWSGAAAWRCSARTPLFDGGYVGAPASKVERVVGEVGLEPTKA